jgi:hypothetical protein
MERKVLLILSDSRIKEQKIIFYFIIAKHCHFKVITVLQFVPFINSLLLWFLNFNLGFEDNFDLKKLLALSHNIYQLDLEYKL